jgi:hypothetical protein
LHLFEHLVLPLELSLHLGKGHVLQRELRLHPLACGALLLELTLHHQQHITLLLKGSGELLGLGETSSRLLPSGVSLRLSEDRVLQRMLGLRLAKHRVLPLKLFLPVLQRCTEFLGLLSLLLCRGAVSVTLLLHVK